MSARRVRLTPYEAPSVPALPADRDTLIRGCQTRLGQGAIRKMVFGFRKRARSRVVLVSFRELTSDKPADASHAYAYKWDLASPPEVGTRVWVPGGDGRPAAAVVAAVDAPLPRGYTLAELKAATRLVTAREIADANAKVTADRDAWLDMARRAAGLAVPGRARTKPPSGFDLIPPADGTASARQAGEFGRVWWRAFKQAEEAGRDTEEVSAYRAIAHRWYAMRDES